MSLTIPMLLTLLRIALIPVFILAFYIPLFGLNNYFVTAIFFIAGVTDWFDGYLARKWDQQTQLGAFFRPRGRQTHGRYRISTTHEQAPQYLVSDSSHYHYWPRNHHFSIT